jgi:putative membrane protein
VEHDTPTTRPSSKSDSDRSSVELAARRTGMSFQRTRMSADRTLMSVIRTSLSLIGFGFTIYQVFAKLHEAEVLKSAAAPHHFGLALVLLGVTMLVVGIGYHVAFMISLRRQRERMKAEGLIHGESQFPVSLTLMVALLLLAIGFLAIASMVFKAGPFD